MWTYISLSLLAACGFFFGAWKNSRAVFFKRDAENQKIVYEKKLAEASDAQARLQAVNDGLKASIEDLRKQLNALSTPAAVLDRFNKLFPPKA